MDEFLNSMVFGDVTLVTGLLWLLIASLISMVGGAIGGMMLAGKEIGYSFSAMLGALFAPAGTIPTLVLGFLALNFISGF
ncbi:MAG TPA: hypothetical protein V6D25_15540 [Leptolyngbyaceae cyanobacterium]